MPDWPLKSFQFNSSRFVPRVSILILVAGLGGWVLSDQAAGHGTCSTHHDYQTYDGTHDSDGDGIGCESLPPPPAGGASEDAPSTGGYDRDSWSFDSSTARSELACSSSEHVDHVVALKEAYDSGGATWPNPRKAEFANDRENLWCLDARVNLSKSDHDLAEWSGGTCSQRQHIAQVTVTVKAKYDLSIDSAEQVAIAIALVAVCIAENGSATSPPTGPGDTPAVDQPVFDFPLGRIVARRLDDGRTEFGYQPAGGERILPRSRFFPRNARVGKWLISSQVTFEGRSIGRISARLLEDGRIEFSFVDTDRQRILPRSRLFPKTSSGNWLRSSFVDPDS
ncbi:MAG: hypothetical protein OXG27_00670 [Chloroflexi bacterium]|nr:hypothetical protein [Chloroflexota bacterium]